MEKSVDALYADCIRTGIDAVVTAITFTSYFSRVDKSRYRYLPAEILASTPTASYNKKLDDIMDRALNADLLPPSLKDFAPRPYRGMNERYGDSFNNHTIHNVLQGHFHPAIAEFYSPLASQAVAKSFTHAIIGDDENSFLNNVQKKDVIVTVLDNIDSIVQSELTDLETALAFSEAVKAHKVAVIAMAKSCDDFAHHLKQN